MENTSVSYNIELDKDMADIIPKYRLARFYFAIVRPAIQGEKPLWSSKKFAEKIISVS